MFAGFAEDAIREYFGPVDFELPLELEAPPFDTTFCFFAVGAGVEELFFFGMAVQISVSGNRSALFVVGRWRNVGRWTDGRTYQGLPCSPSLAHKIANVKETQQQNTINNNMNNG